MKAALFTDRASFEKYSDWTGAGWDLVFLGRGAPDPATITATGAEVLVVDPMMKIGQEIISGMPGLNLIQSLGVGYNGIDLDAARSAGIYVCNNAGVNAMPVAEQAVLLILALLRRFRCYEDMVYAGRQIEAKTACFENGLTELCELSVGIIGYGDIGKALISLLKPFGCKIYYYTRSGDHNLDGVEYMPLDELYASCDIVSLNLPVTPETTNMINEETLKRFKPGAILINTARGELMDNDAVAAALNSGRLGGLGADTIAPAPVQADNPLLCALTEESRLRVALSPHIGGITTGCSIRAFAQIRENIEAIERGQKPKNVVNSL